MSDVIMKVKQFLQNKWVRWGLVIGWMVLIFYFSAQNGNDSTSNNRFLVTLMKKFGIDLDQLLGLQVNFLIRKAAHMTEYFILMLLVYNALRGNRFGGKRLFIGFIITVLYAATDEIHQAFIPGRACMARDVLIDSAGALITVGVLLWSQRREKRRA